MTAAARSENIAAPSAPLREPDLRFFAPPRLRV